MGARTPAETSAPAAPDSRPLRPLPSNLRLLSIASTSSRPAPTRATLADAPSTKPTLSRVPYVFGEPNFVYHFGFGGRKRKAAPTAEEDVTVERSSKRERPSSQPEKHGEDNGEGETSVVEASAPLSSQDEANIVAALQKRLADDVGNAANDKKVRAPFSLFLFRWAIFLALR